MDFLWVFSTLNHATHWQLKTGQPADHFGKVFDEQLIIFT